MSHDKIASTFDAWVDDGRVAGLEQGHKDKVEQAIAGMDIQAGEKILDLGCGDGWATRMLAKSEAGVQAIGVDCSPRMIQRADELHSFTIRARYDFGTFENLDFKDDEFDRVFSMEALYYSPDPERALAEAFRVLKPGGRAEVLLDFYEENEGSATWNEGMACELLRRGETGWREAFEAAGFEVVELQRVVDRRGPGEESDFHPSKHCPSWKAKKAAWEAGSLWIRARKP
jgi:ubiquinone/menaquinone biosynthesis C-methylase UbiE